MNTGEVTDPRIRAILLGGGAGIASAPFVVGAAQDALKKRATEKKFQKRIDDRRERLAQRYGQQIATQAPKTGIMSALGRMAGPVGTVTGMLMPTQMGDATLQGNEQMLSAEGTGITSGLAEVAQETQSLEKEIDAADDYAGVMNALRGDNKTIKERRSELATHVGSKDADATPESVLTLVQPTLNVLEVVEQEAPEGGINSGMMQAPNQQQAMARMAMGEQPVMRAEGTKEGGENLRGQTLPLNLSNLDLIKGLVPEPKGYDAYLKQYQETLGGDKTGFELNPQIAMLNLAAAVANAPKGELLSSILAPETIKAVSDPILQMAQAKSKTEQAIKLKALEASQAAQTAAASARSDLMKTALPKLLESPDLQQFGDKESGFYAFNPNNPTEIFTLKEGVGPKPTIFGDKESGYGYLDKNNKYIEIKEGKGPRPQIFGSDKFGYFYLDENNQVKDAKEGFGQDKQIFGNAETGYFAYDGETAESIQEGVGKAPPEFIQLINRYNKASNIVNNEQSTPEAMAQAAQEMVFLSDKLTTKDPEFTTLMNQKADMIYNQTVGTDAKKLEAKNQFIAKTIDEFIKGKSTVAQNYNPNEALDKEFAGMFGKLVEDINKGADNARKLQGLADTAVLASNNFKTGAFAETRLSITKMIDAVGGRDALRAAIGDERFNDLFSDSLNDVKSGELVKSIGAQFAVMMAESFPGNLNQSEVQLIIDAGPNIGVSGEGLKTLQKVFADANRRAQLESEFATQFLQDKENMGLGAEAKYAKFNEGLAKIRAANPVITQEMVDALEANTASGAVPDGALAVQDSSGQKGYVPADQVAGYNAVKSAPDRATFIANFRQLQATNPGLQGLDAGQFYDSMINLVKVN